MLAPHCHQNWHFAALPAAKPTPCSLPTPPQAQRKELPVVEYMDKGYVVTCVPKRPWPMNETTAVPIRLRTKTRIRADTHTNTTPLLALYCHPNDPVARTVLLPESDNCRACMPAIQWPIDRLSSKCLTYYHYLMLAPHYHQNWHFAAFPVAAYLGTTILCFYNLLAAYSDTTILWFYFILII